MKPAEVGSYYKNRNVLVLGGAGFIGSNIAVKLVQLKARVFIIDALFPECGGNIFNISHIKRKVHFYHNEASKLSSLPGILKRCDTVFNCMGCTNHLTGLRRPLQDLKYNVVNHLHFLEACLKYNLKLKIIFLGSRSQYGKACSGPLKESDPMYASDFHGAHKTLGELYHSLYHAHFKLGTVIARITNVYGPRQDMRSGHSSIINGFVRDIMDNKKILIFGNVSRVKDFLYVDDVVKGLLIIGMHADLKLPIYNLGGNPVKLTDVAQKIIKIMHKGESEVVPFPDEIREINVDDIILDSSKIKNELCWQPEIDLDKGLSETIEFYSKQRKSAGGKN